MFFTDSVGLFEVALGQTNAILTKIKTMYITLIRVIGDIMWIYHFSEVVLMFNKISGVSTIT